MAAPFPPPRTVHERSLVWQSLSKGSGPRGPPCLGLTKGHGPWGRGKASKRWTHPHRLRRRGDGGAWTSGKDGWRVLGGVCEEMEDLDGTREVHG